MIRYVSVTLALSAALMGAAACSGGPPQDVSAIPGEKGAEAVVSAYANSLAEGDAARACSLVAPQVQRQIEQRTTQGDCLGAVRSIAATLTPQAAKHLRDIEVTGTDAEGDTVEVRLETSGAGGLDAKDALGGSVIALTRTEEHWEISGASD